MKLTNAQTWLIHSLEALALAAIVTAVAIIFPQAQNGTLTWQTLSAGLLSAIIAVASKSGASILTNSQTAQALSDTVSQAVQAATPTPVVIHNNMPPAPAMAPVASQGINLAPVTAPAQPQFIEYSSAIGTSTGFTSLEIPAVPAGQ